LSPPSGLKPNTNQATATWRAAPSAVSVLIACGWLRSGDAAHPGLRIAVTSSSHELTRVTAPDGRCVVVKQVPQHAAAHQRSLTSEMFVYRLARWVAEIARAVPNPVFIDEGRHVIVVEALATGARWPDPATRAAIASPKVCSQLGAVLAGVHRATADMAMWSSPGVGILGLPVSITEACLERPPNTQALMRFIAEDPEFGTLLNTGAAAYTARCVIHGDLRQENWLIDDREQNGMLKLFDWELAGAGDPAWDVGSLVAEAVLDNIRQHRVDASTGPLPTSVEEPMRALLAAYFEKPTPLNSASGDTWRKLALYASARLLHVACECTDQGVDHREWPVTAIVDTARRIAQREATVSRQLQRWMTE
jgi:Ser/Thr protein kinase RdoA (MazF antagonist)